MDWKRCPIKYLEQSTKTLLKHQYCNEVKKNKVRNKLKRRWNWLLMIKMCMLSVCTHAFSYILSHTTRLHTYIYTCTHICSYTKIHSQTEHMNTSLQREQTELTKKRHKYSFGYSLFLSSFLKYLPYPITSQISIIPCLIYLHDKLNYWNYQLTKIRN